MNFFSLKDQTTFRDYLVFNGYSTTKTLDTGYTVLSVHQTLKLFADDIGISVRTARRWYDKNEAPKYIMKLLYIMYGYMEEIHPLWKGFGINRKTGELFCQDSPTMRFTPSLLHSAYWHRERAGDYNRLMLKLETEREKLKDEKQKNVAQYLDVIEEATKKAASDALRAVLGIEPKKATLQALTAVKK